MLEKFSWSDLIEFIGAISIVAGLILVAYELRQNSQLMRAQVFSDRSNQGIEVFLTIAENRELSEIDAILMDAGFPDNPTAYSQLSPAQKRQYAWFMRADRFRLENILYQQLIGAIEYDEGHIMGAKNIIERFNAMGEDSVVSAWGDPTFKLRHLVAQLEQMYEQDD